MRIRPRKRPAGRNRPAPFEPIPKSSGAVFSYRSSSRSSEAPQGRHQAARPPFVRRLLRTITGLTLIIGLVYISTLTPNPVIKNVSARSDATLLRSESTYLEAARHILADSILDHSKVTIDTGGFERAMKAKFPELEQAAITLPLVSRRPNVTLVAKKPILVLNTQQGAYLLDKDGIAIIRTADVAGFANLKLPAVSDESNIPLEPGKGVLTNQDMIFILVLNAQLVAGKQTVQSISLPPVINELHVRLKDQPYFIKFDMQNDPRTSAGAFLALKQKLDADHTVPADYIDLRLDERAFYK